MRRAIKFVAVYLCLSFVFGLLWIVFSYPKLPSSPTQWIGVFLLALPMQIAGELIGDLLWNNKVTRLVEQKTGERSFSVLRIAYGILFVLLLVGLVFAATFAWDWLGSFFKT
jgi:hypothetical protein